MKNESWNPCLSFIVLTWNSERFLQGCFTSIINKCNDEGISFEVIVIDNGSRDGSTQIVDKFQNEYGNKFSLIALDQNKGTTYPRNLGLIQSHGEYLCILDSDTELGDGSLKGVIEALLSEQSVGLIAPRLLLPDGTVQNSVKRFPTMLDKLAKIPRILFGIKTVNSDFYEHFPFTNACKVDSAISACWFFRRELLETVGYLDENIFYSPEDIDFSLRVWKSGYVNIFFPKFTVLHHTQHITHRKPFSKTSLSHFWGLLYYYRKHGGWFVRPQVAQDRLNVQ